MIHNIFPLRIHCLAEDTNTQMTIKPFAKSYNRCLYKLLWEQREGNFSSKDIKGLNQRKGHFIY